MNPGKATRFIGLSVEAAPGEAPERLVRRFIRRVRESGIVREFVAREGYEKPSVKRRRKDARAAARRRREEKLEKRG